MGAFKEIAIVEERDADVVLDYHDWQFVEHRTDSLSKSIERSNVLAEYASSYARTLHSGDEAIDVIEKPHHYAEEIASHIAAYWDFADQIIPKIGYWECSVCDEQSATMTIKIQYGLTCRGDLS